MAPGRTEYHQVWLTPFGSKKNWLSTFCCIQLGGEWTGSYPSKTIMFERLWRWGEVCNAWRQANDLLNFKKRGKNNPERCSLDRVNLGSGKIMEAFWNTFLGMGRRRGLLETAGMHLPRVKHIWQAWPSSKYSCIQVRTLQSGEVDNW